ncbi:hypothetical protein [Flavobacterium sp. '19STA2R22 D10 B1']|uniref:hypothetical protein n=1 Tax=Flavobacterium aerium TaxID=3037261 RepID=UPI00278C49AD|nr:hypothetical protein [Flavobacterium sp. '19STA2R22 D10 B1']
MQIRSKFIFAWLLFMVISGTFSSAHAQSILATEMSIHADHKPLGTILDLMEEKGKFRFSYYSKIVPKDSIISIHADRSTVKEVIDRLLSNRYECKESKDFIILRYAPLELALALEKNSVVGEYHIVSGYITDVLTSKPIENASVYEKNALQSTLTDKDGFFELRLKNINQPIELTVAKENYKNITTMFLSEITIQIGSKKTILDYVTGDFSEIERTGVGRFFISSRQKIQSLNLGGFIAKAPVQASLIPSISTRGMMNTQIVNNFSLNLLGGYNGGVRGLEIAGLYNINRMNVEALQIAGVFNTVGGSVKGVQLAGIYNNVFGDLKGIQMSGIHNSVKGSQIGIQVSGLYNNVRKDSKGIQIAGIHNTVNGSQNGLQIAFGYNTGNGKVRGAQIAGLFNYAKDLHGIQVGLVNITGSTSGYSFGLLNFKKGGYKKFTVTRNEISDVNFSIKTGDNKLYTILMAGRSERENEEKLTSFGIGLGKNIQLSRRLSYNPEISIQYLYLGNWENLNFLRKFDSPLTFRLTRGIALSAGPSFNIYTAERIDKNVPDTNTSTFVQNRTERSNVIKDRGVLGWVGWSFGLTLF